MALPLRQAVRCDQRQHTINRGFGAVLLVGWRTLQGPPHRLWARDWERDARRVVTDATRLALESRAAETAGACPAWKEIRMHAIVIYESHWGCTKAVAEAIAEGIGKDARALTTDEATGEVLAGADLVVAGAPVIAFALPRTGATAQLAADTKAPRPADVSHPLLRTWLERMPAGRGGFAAFETRIWWSPRGATGTIESRFSKAGYRKVAKAERFVVAGAYGPLREGELERAREWGATLKAAIGAPRAKSAA
jgi:hypothetical protein